MLPGFRQYERFLICHLCFLIIVCSSLHPLQCVQVTLVLCVLWMLYRYLPLTRCLSLHHQTPPLNCGCTAVGKVSNVYKKKYIYIYVYIQQMSQYVT